MGVTLYVGGDPALWPLDGWRCFTAAQRPRTRLAAARVRGLLDSGAFSDPPGRRLDPERALERQLAWERRATEFWRAPAPWRAEALVSYDRLIDEVWTAGLGGLGLARHKRRWTVAAAEGAVRETVEAARFLAARRAALAPRALVLACQGVDAAQYRECAAEVLKVATPADWLGLGGWCVLGRWRRRWLSAFWETLHACLPLAARAGLRHVHLFGVLWPPALGGLLWLADRHGLAASTDSSAPLLGGHLARPEEGRCPGRDQPGQRGLVAPAPGHSAGEPPLPGAAAGGTAAGVGAVTGSRTGASSAPLDDAHHIVDSTPKYREGRP